MNRDELIELRLPITLRAERDDGYRQAVTLFKTVAPQCEPLDTTAGVITQIDNYIAGLWAEREALREALGFYANPETYFAIGMFPDPPCGAFMEDFSETDDLGLKPGKLARAALARLDAQTEEKNVMLQKCPSCGREVPVEEWSDGQGVCVPCGEYAADA